MQMFKDPSGKTSETRITKQVVTFTFMAVWAWLSVQKGEMIKVDPGVVAVILSLATGSAIKSFAENRKGQE